MALDVVRVLANGQTAPREFAPRTAATNAPLRFEWATAVGSATISSVSWSLSPANGTIAANSLTDSSQTAIADVSALTENSELEVICEVTDSDGAVREARARLFCKATP